MNLSNSSIEFTANRMSKAQAQFVDRELRKAKNVDIICHDTTDKDAANSALAMWEYLNNIGVHSRIIISQKNPKLLNLRTYNFNIVQSNDKDEIEKVKPDIAFCVDFGSEKRISPIVYEHILKAPKIMGFDHHKDLDIAKDGYIQFQEPIENSQNILSSAPFYSDNSAKSATSVIYRYFEALDKKFSKDIAYDLFFGFISDCNKKGLVVCDGNKGTIIACDELKKDKNAYEIYQNLRKMLTDEDISFMAKKIDIMADLTDEEKSFSDSLYKKINFSKNGKVAYVAIAVDDEEWKSLGEDNIRTSAILNNFRRNVLKLYPDVKVALVFYKAEGAYRISIHSKDFNLDEFYDYAKDNIDFDFSLGGHSDRGGGKLSSLDIDTCNGWIEKIVDCFNDLT